MTFTSKMIIFSQLFLLHQEHSWSVLLLNLTLNYMIFQHDSLIDLTFELILQTRLRSSSLNIMNMINIDIID